jgi:hypothetical protein
MTICGIHRKLKIYVKNHVEFGGFHSGGYEEFYLLGYNAV